MANNKNCKDNVFKSITSNPDFSDFLNIIQGSSNDVRVGTDSPRVSIREETINKVTTFYVDFIPYINLEVTLFTLDESGLKLKGDVVTTLNFNWEYNKPVESQSITGGVSAPIVNSNLNYSLTLSGQNITSNRSYTLTADDDAQDQIGSIQGPTRSITFGNYIYQTQIATNDRNSIDNATINALNLINLVKTNSTSRNLTFTADSDATEYEVLLVPNSLGLNTGNQFRNNENNFTGGWSKLIDISLTNELNFTETYGVWVSVNRNLNGSTFTIL